MTDYPEILTIEQAASMLQVSTRTIQRMVKAGRMPGRQVGSQWRFDRDQLRDWVRGQQVERENSGSQRELIERERARLGVDLPETLVEMQQVARKRLADSSRDPDPDDQ